MYNDPKAEELRSIAMTGSANGAERTTHFITYHEYILSQFLMSPIYQPVVNIGYNKDRITLPAQILAPAFQSIAIMDLEVVE